jgi:aminoglycoside 2''-phosphotransferase
MPPLTAYQAAIHATAPALRIETIIPLGAGQYNDVLLVNGDLIFRFPRHAEEVGELRAEVALLRGLRGRLPVAIPDPIYVWLAAPVGEACVGYPRLPGEVLTPALLATGVAAGVVDALAQQLAGCLRALHEVPAEALGLPLRVVATPAAWAELYTQFRAELFPQMRADACQRVAAGFETYLAEAASAPPPVALVHGDFGPGNLLADLDRGLLTGIVDWSSAGLGDPAVDLAALICAVGYGEAFVRAGFAAYPALEEMLPRARFYASTFALQEALFGLRRGDAEAFERGIVGYR